ncbi:MAG: O-acetyl-ADP-ribose deacetylase [Christensenellales bacterium]|jgi:O-acetyl-ADP-ribose deacetylase (regulator of RNase III)
MPFQIVRNDITKMETDAIVNAANETLLGGGGVDGAIHRAAGKALLEECRKLNGCKTGEAKITKGYLLPAKYVIHTVGPIWAGGKRGEEALLRACYRNSLKLAKEYGLESIAFPLISSGAYGYPKRDALRVATQEIASFLDDNDMTVVLVLFDIEFFPTDVKTARDVARYIDDVYAEERIRRNLSQKVLFDALQHYAAPLGKSLDDALRELDEGFTEMLLRKIDEKGMKDAECYRRANIDRKLFSKIRSDARYKPSKRTAVALGIALQLPLDEMRSLLDKAGYSLSRSSKFDIIIEYCVTHGQYDIYQINEILFSYDQALLGA